MKKYLLLIFIVLLTISCGVTDNLTEPVSPANDPPLPEQNAAPADVPAAPPPAGEPPAVEAPPTCYEGEHPIAAGIAEDYAALTDYEEIMTWFCNGADFEDILNALLTEEMTGVEAKDLLVEIAQGKTWNDIWLELGVTE